MRILAATPYAEPEGGGLERYAHATLSRLAARGHDVRQVAFTLGPTRDEVRDGVRLRRIHAAVRIGNTPLGGGFGAALRQAIRDQRPDVVVAHTPVPTAAHAAWRAARRDHLPFVVTYHAGRLHGSSLALEAVARLYGATFERRLLGDAARLIAVSPVVRERALATHAQRTHVIAPGVDGRLFTPMPGARDGVLFVAPLDQRYRWKGVDVLWEAFLLLRGRRPATTLRLVGSGDRLADFQAKAAAVPGVRVDGRLDEAGLLGAYRAASVLVLPSTSDAESFGMVLAEANACGTPVVGSDIGGIPFVVRPGENGLLAPAGDAQRLAGALLRLLDDPELAAAMGRRGRERVLRDFDWDRRTDATERVLAEAVGRPADTGASLQADGAQPRQRGQRVGSDAGDAGEGASGGIGAHQSVARVLQQT